MVSSGALNVCFTDGDDPYRQRARRMLLGTLLVGLAVLTGTLSGHSPLINIAIAGVWAFAAGMMVAVNQTATDLGVTTLVTLVVFSAQPMQPHQAVSAGFLAIGGGLLQTIFALALWPVVAVSTGETSAGESLRRPCPRGGIACGCVGSSFGQRAGHRRPQHAGGAGAGPYGGGRPLPVPAESGGAHAASDC